MIFNDIIHPTILFFVITILNDKWLTESLKWLNKKLPLLN